MSALSLDFAQCYRAMESRDARFDGWFVIGVRTTRIYCRPSCPAPVIPKARNVRFFKTAAAAQLAGLRACKRCRPDAVPGSPEWDVRADLAGRAMRAIAEGLVDRCGVHGLAASLAVSERHLHRVLVDAVGAPPVALARAQRARAARSLIETTSLSFSEIAFAAGFSSVRQFNDTIRRVYGSSPSALRAVRRAADGSDPEQLTVRLALRGSYDGAGVLRWLAARAVPGVEEVVDGVYRRTMMLPGGVGVVRLEPRGDFVQAGFRIPSLADLAVAVHRCRRLLDLDADPEAVAEVLAADDALAPLVRRNPGVRVVGSVDGAETVVRAVLGQQVSLGAARTLAARLVRAYGRPLEEPRGTLTHAFPPASDLAAASLEDVAVPAARRRTLRELAARLADGRLVLDGGADRGDVRRRLMEVPGIGPWTAEYVSMRALGDPDAFPASDLGLLRSARRLGVADGAAALSARSESWRPWRAYAAHHLWGDDG